MRHLVALGLALALAACTEYPWIRWTRAGQAKSPSSAIEYFPGVWLKTPFGSRDCYRSSWAAAPKDDIGAPGLHASYVPSIPHISTTFMVRKDGFVDVKEFECWPLGERPAWAARGGIVIGAEVTITRPPGQGSASV